MRPVCGQWEWNLAAILTPASNISTIFPILISLAYNRRCIQSCKRWLIDSVSPSISRVCMRWPFLSFSKKKRERQREREGERVETRKNERFVRRRPKRWNSWNSRETEIFGVWCVGQNRRGQHVLYIVGFFLSTLFCLVFPFTFTH